VALVTGIAAGTSNATITVTDANATNNPQTVSVTWTISAIPDPTAQSATADGREMVRLAWTKNASYNVMIVHNGTNAPSVPVNGTTYSLGPHLRGWLAGHCLQFRFKRIGTCRIAWQHELLCLLLHEQQLLLAGCERRGDDSVYQAGEVVEQFGYTNAVGLQALGGGQGWTNSWTISVPRTNTDAVVDSVNFATFQSFWPG
jgi:hypothetical protein